MCSLPWQRKAYGFPIEPKHGLSSVGQPIPTSATAATRDALRTLTPNPSWADGYRLHIPLWGSAYLKKERGLNMEYEGYCVKCRTKRTVANGEVAETKTGRPMAKGPCPVCGTTVTRFLSAKEAGK